MYFKDYVCWMNEWINKWMMSMELWYNFLLDITVQFSGWAGYASVLYGWYLYANQREHPREVISVPLERSWESKARKCSSVPGGKSQDLSWHLIHTEVKGRSIDGYTGNFHSLQLCFYVFFKFSQMTMICFNNRKKRLFKRRAVQGDVLFIF